VINEINSLTHSCMHSLASLAILALSGKACFMIRATGAKFRISVSDIDIGGLSASAAQVRTGVAIAASAVVALRSVSTRNTIEFTPQLVGIPDEEIYKPPLQSACAAHRLV
jgi:hypothetical protein